jgi:pilus assembly protein CpaD
MIDAASKTSTAAARRSASGAPYYRPAASLLAAASIVLLAGCTAWGPRDSVVVGAIPDDYRTNHPIVIAEKERSVDLPVAPSDRGATKTQAIALSGFLQDYDTSADPVLTIVVPHGSINEAAASAASHDLIRVAKNNGVPGNRIVLASYQAPAADASAPIRVSYIAMTAQTNKCGRWTDDIISDTTANKHYTDFGCSSQQNLAAQIDNPADLLGPRKQTEIDAENRSRVIDDYRDGPATLRSSEVNY